MSIWFYRFCQFLLFLIFKLWNGCRVEGSSNLPNNGFILAANHTSFLDPPVLGGMVRRPLVFAAKDELFSVPILGKVIKRLGALPVRAKSDFRNIRIMIRSLKEGRAVVMFPQGTRIPEGQTGRLEIGVIFLAQVTGAPIVPCYIHGTSKALPPGKRFFRPHRIRVNIGKPYQLEASEAKDEKFYERALQDLMKRIWKLKL
jgi:1-acyl-sn-glycerol-3-phosphate acyltransferase